MDMTQMRMHAPQHGKPHWSETVEWRPDRWDPMDNAPTEGQILEVRGRDAAGSVLEPMHYAYGGGDEQPAFRGWFVPFKSGRGFFQVSPVEWQPLRVPTTSISGQTKEPSHG